MKLMMKLKISINVSNEVIHVNKSHSCYFIQFFGTYPSAIEA
jgi:hypothetical protein